MSGLYLAALVVVTYFTRATPRRVAGALAGGAAASLMALGVIALCEVLGWWQLPFVSTPYWVIMLYVCLAISLTPIYLVTWRLASNHAQRSVRRMRRGSRVRPTE